MMDAAEWLIEFYSRTSPSTVLGRYTPNGGVVTVDGAGSVATTAALVLDLTYRTTPEGFGIDAGWLAGDADGLPVADWYGGVVVYRRGSRAGESASTFYPRFAGVVTLLPSVVRPRGEPGRYRAIGWRDALFRVDSGPNVEQAAGSDLRAYFNELRTLVPAPLTQPEVTVDYGVSVTGAVNADSASLGAYYDGLAALGFAGGLDLVWGVTPEREVQLVERASTSLAVDASSGGVEVSEWEVQATDNVQRVRWLLGDSGLRYDPTTGADEPRLTPDPLTHVSESGTPGETVALVPPEGQSVFIPMLSRGVYDPSWAKLVFRVQGNTSDPADVTPRSRSGITTDPLYTLAATVLEGAGVTTLSVTSLPAAVPAGAILSFPPAVLGDAWLVFLVTTSAGAGATTVQGIQVSGNAPSGGSGFRLDRALSLDPNEYVIMADTSVNYWLGIVGNPLPADLAGFAYAINYESADGIDQGLCQLGIGGSVKRLNGTPGAFASTTTFDGVSYVWGVVYAGGSVGLLDESGTVLRGDRQAVPAVGAFAGFRGLANILASATVQSVVIRTLNALRVDTEALDALAEQEYASPTVSAARVLVYGSDPSPVGLLDLTLADGTFVGAMPVDHVEVRLSTEVGAVSTFVCGERELAEVTAFTRAVQARDSRATVRGAKAGLRGTA